MQPYFEYTHIDSEFYREYIHHRIPAAVFDVHIHCNLPEHVAMVPEERWLSDWALECRHVFPCDDAHFCIKELFPACIYSFAGLPLPVREADMGGNNRYLSRMGILKKLIPFMAVRPEWNRDELEKTLLEGGFVGVKPYADMVSGVKGAEISIFEFFPHEQWDIVNRHHKAVMLHLPRKKRLSDDNNIRELLYARDRYPDVAIIIAHLGRSYTPCFLEEGLRKLVNPEYFYFDTAAVLNPEVYTCAFSAIPAENIFFGTDMPILLWHGKQEWSDTSYTNICREDFTWNTNRRSPKEEALYTLFVYEEVRAILDAVERHGLSEEQKCGIFGNNARRALGIT